MTFGPTPLRPYLAHAETGLGAWRYPKMVKPDWRIVRVNWTAYVGEEYLAEKQVKELGVYYLLDANRHVHICSFTPNLEAWPMNAYVEFLTEEACERDQGETELETLNSEEACSYFGTDVLESPWQTASKYVDLPEREGDETDEELYMRTVETVREYLCGNPAGF